MATTRIIAMHRTKGKSVAQCIKDRTGYAFNPDKTNDGELVTCYECDIKSVDTEFTLSKREYQQITGRTQQGTLLPIKSGNHSSRVRQLLRKPIKVAVSLQ